MLREDNDLLISYNSGVGEPDSNQDLVCHKFHSETWVRMRTSNLRSLIT